MRVIEGEIKAESALEGERVGDGEEDDGFKTSLNAFTFSSFFFFFFTNFLRLIYYQHGQEGFERTAY